MRTSDQVASAVVARVVEKTSLGSPLDGSIWKTSIKEEVDKFKIEVAFAVAERLKKSKAVKDKQRKAIAAELDGVFGDM